MRKFRLSMLLFILLNSLSPGVQATPQEEDLIIYEGARYYTSKLPDLSEALLQTKMPEFIWFSTANWNGYRASWAIIDKQLYLVGVEGTVKNDDGARFHSSQELFPDIVFPFKVTNYSGDIVLGGRSPDDDIRDENGDVLKVKKIILKIENGQVNDQAREIINPDQVAREKSKQLLHKNGVIDLFGELFSFSEMWFCKYSSTSVDFDGPECSVHLTPRKICPIPCVIECAFAVTGDDEVDVKITPLQIHDALTACMINPVVLERIKAVKGTGFRMRITGDRLHWSTRKLQELYTTTTTTEGRLKGEELKHWVYLIIDGKEPRYTSLYLNIKSGDIIFDN